MPWCKNAAAGVLTTTRKYDHNKLFIIYISDLCNISQRLKLILFADDINIFGSGEDLQQLLDNIT